MDFDTKTTRLAILLCGFAWLTNPIFSQNTGCAGILGPNVFPDGTLGSGQQNILPNDPGIAPGYVYTLFPPPDDGYYCIANSTAGWQSFAELFWLDIGDNSPDPNGYMMVVNADYAPKIFYQRTVNVCQNTPYIFSTDIINLFLPQFPDAILPNVDFLINGNLVYSTGDIPMDMTWHTYEFAVTPSPTATQFTFALRNNAPGGFGNDLALDNISLRFCGPKISLPQVLTDCDGIINLQPTFQGNPWQNAFYQWQTSTNGGLTWTNIPGANNQVLNQANSQSGQQFRLLMSGAAVNLNDPYCRAISNVVTVQIPVVQGFAQQTICQGEGVEIGGQWLTQSGIYQIQLTAANGCDSILTFDLQVLNHSSSTLQAEICEGETYQFGSLSLSTTGTYDRQVPNSVGCDSLISLQLLVRPNADEEIFQTICEGESYFFDGEMHSIEGDYTANGHTVFGCDSTTVLHLHVQPVFVTNLSAQICQGSSYWFNNQQITTAGTYHKLLQSTSGCDSLVTLALTVASSLSEQLTVQICHGGSYWFNNQHITTAGTYQQLLQNASGCDSLVTLYLTVAPSLSEQLTAQICQGSSYWFNNQQIMTAGTYQQLVQNASGCDSLVTLALTVAPSLSEQLTVQICHGNSYQFGNQILSTAGVYQQNFQTQGGCDSLVTLSLEILPQIVTNLAAEICEGSSFAFGNLQISNPGIYQQTLTTAAGCDSLVVLELSVLPVVYQQISETICEGSTYQFGNQTLTNSGIYHLQLQTTNGCDSLVTLALYVLPTETTNLTAQICPGEVYTFGAAQLGVTGFYQQNLLTTGGCDSLVTLALEVLPTATTDLTAQICQGESIPFGNQLLASTGLYQQNLQTWQGCDSLVTMDLVVYPIQTTDVFVEICEGEAFKGQTFTQSNLLVDTLSAVLTGCDSIVLTHLTVWPKKKETISAFRCWGDEYEGIPVFSDTMLVKLDQSIHGCDSTTVCHITVDEKMVASITAPRIICALETAKLKVGSFYAYNWSTGDTSADINVQTAGNYSVTVSDINGCTATANHMLMVSEPILQSQLIEPRCHGDKNGEIHLAISNGIEPYRVSYDGSAFMEQKYMTGLSAGMHSLIVIDSVACTITKQVFLPEPPLFEVIAKESQTIQLGDSVELYALSTLPIADYEWVPPIGLDCNDCPSPIAKPFSSTNYHLNAVDEKGCKDESMVSIIVKKADDIYIPTAFSPNGDGTNDFFTVYAGRSVKKIKQLLVFDRWGELVFEAFDATPYDISTHWHGDFRDMPAQVGVYIWLVEVEYIDGNTRFLKGDLTLMK